MSVSNGQQASAATFNGAFVSKTANSTVSADLNVTGTITQDKESILKEIGTPTTPASGYGKIYFKSDGKLYQLNDAGTETQVGSGSGGGGGVNFITNGDAEGNATTGWSVYADAAGTSPVDGTGGSANVTIAATATAPLVGNYSFLMAKDAANRQGQGWSYDFTIAQAYRAKVLQISFDYLVSSGTFSAGSSSANSDVTVWIYDVTNAVLIQPSNIKLFSNNASITDKFQASFQSASNSGSYRLIFHVQSTSASAYTLEVDNVSVGPSDYVFGTPVTDWQSYTPTFTGMGTVTGVDIQYRRVGDSLQLRGKFTSGTSTAVEARLSFPSGLTSSDTTKIASIQIAGQMNVASATNQFVTLIEPSVTYITFGLQNGTTDPRTKQNGSTIFSNGVVYNIIASIPIAGWSSSVQTSDSADTRVVDFVADRSGTQAVTADVTDVTFSTVLKDSHGAWNGSVYTVPVSGDYLVSAMTVNSGASSSNARIFKNGVVFRIGTISSGTYTIAIAIVPCVAGNTISIRDGFTQTLGGGNISISRISGPSAIAASESVNASYYISAGASTANNVQFNFDTKVFDSHNAVTTGAGAWKFTAPISGKYQISCSIYAANNNPMSLWKNGAVYRYMGYSFGTTATGLTVPNTALISLNAGDYIDIRSGSNTVTPTASNFTGATTANTNFVDIIRVGN